VTGRPEVPATIVGADGRAKAYRPLPADVRAAAVRDGLDAYDRGDYFEAHELLEPAWMGSADPAERSVLQGLIKLAAAYVHEVRGNPPGIEKNLVGARERLADGVVGGAGPGSGGAGADGAGADGLDVDVPALILEIDLRLADLAAHPDGPTLPPPILVRRAR
jgi:hypothetical protein